MTSTDTEMPPEISAAETADAIVEASKRDKEFPLRREFLQTRTDGKVTAHGPLSEIVRSGDLRGLLLFLLLVTKASAPPYDTALPAAVWARALDLPLLATSSGLLAGMRALTFWPIEC